MPAPARAFLRLEYQDVALAKRWIAAAGRARGDAFQAMGETEAWFEVRIER